MRGFLVVVIAIGLGGVYHWQKQGAVPTQETVKANVSQPHSTPSAATPRQEAVTQPQPLSEHNWMKRSLDRARDVRDNSAGQTKQSQDPWSISLDRDTGAP
jgi:uncharacterized protein HemX